MQKACGINYSDRVICKGREKEQYELGYKCGGGNDNSFQYPCQENPIDIRAWQSTVHGVTKSWT